MTAPVTRAAIDAILALEANLNFWTCECVLCVDMRSRAAPFESTTEVVIALAAERDALTAQLAECYRASGADPDGDEDWRLSGMAVRAVTDARNDYEAEDVKQQARIDALQATVQRVQDFRELLRQYQLGTVNKSGTKSESIEVGAIQGVLNVALRELDAALLVPPRAEGA